MEHQHAWRTVLSSSSEDVRKERSGVENEGTGETAYQDLPAEMNQVVFSFLPIEDWMSLRLVDRSHRDMITTEDVLKRRDLDFFNRCRSKASRYASDTFLEKEGSYDLGKGIWREIHGWLFGPLVTSVYRCDELHIVYFRDDVASLAERYRPADDDPELYETHLTTPLYRRAVLLYFAYDRSLSFFGKDANDGLVPAPEREDADLFGRITGVKPIASYRDGRLVFPLLESMTKEVQAAVERNVAPADPDRTKADVLNTTAVSYLEYALLRRRTLLS